MLGVTLAEKEARAPAALSGKEVVLDGYNNEIDILTLGFSLKKIYLRLIRRRWKEKGTSKHYSKEYNLHIPGMKTTKEFRDFLKENGGWENDRQEFYTVMTNRERGKIALLAEPLTVTELNKLIDKTGGARQIVKTPTANLSPTYEKFCEQRFPVAMIVADKFPG